MSTDRNPDDLSDEQLVELVVDAGTLTGAGSEFGWLRDKFTRYIGSRGLLAQVKAALEEAKEAEAQRRVAEEEAERAAESDEAEPTLEDEVTEVEILRARTRELERQVKQVRETQVAEQRIIDALHDAIVEHAPRFSPNAIPRTYSGDFDEHEFALLFSDTHAGEVVKAEETLGMNEYDWDVMLRRMAKIQDSVLSYQGNRPYPVKKLHVWQLGDMLSGDIHDELTETNEMNSSEATVQFGYDNAAWLEGFAEHFEEIAVAGVPGNHPRRNRKPQAKNAHNNGDWIAYKIAELALRGHPQFSFNFPRAAFASVTVAERWRTLLMHGDGIRSTMPGVPWGGVVRRITTLEQQFAKARQPLDYVALGHFHTANSLDGVGVKTFLNGSVKGLDEYSLKAFGSGRAPSQLLLTFHPRHGITDVSMIDLEPTSPAGSR